jgi:hypothetical protein
MRSSKLGRLLGSLLVLFFGTLVSPASNAAVIALTFDDLAGTGDVPANYESHGFRFSPNCHRDGFVTGDWPSPALGWDWSSCDTNFNPDWVGPPALAGGQDMAVVGSWMYVDYLGGGPFTLLSSDVIDAGYGVQILSSKGGVFDFPTVPPSDSGSFTFTGPAWTGISWLLMSGGSGTPAGVDNMTFRVPEPQTLALLGLGLLGLAFTRSRK